MSHPLKLAAALLAAGVLSSAHAAAPSIAGSFGSGITTGSVKAESYHYSQGFDSAANWTFWTFTADVFSDVTITVTPSSAEFDPIIAVWYGVETDTANYFGNMNDSSLFTPFVIGADGTSNDWLAGPGKPASLTFTNIYGSGPFVLAIADWQDNVGSATHFDYTITATVPEPETWAQLALGLGLLGGLSRARRNRAR
jgi:hypothetical protein